MTDEERVRWLYEVSEFEADENTYKFESMPKPEDPVLRAAIALIRRCGMYSELMVVPEDLVEFLGAVLAALNDGSGASGTLDP